MRKNYFVALAFLTALSSACSSAMITTIHADESKGWSEEDGIMYWYENGVKQGTEGRGKEIYDPVSDAWYWLDAVDGGKMAVSKDVYQESRADDEGTIGKWVRYDENGHMVKGWDTNENGRYYFDPVYGTMAKGDADIDGVHYYFNKDTGVLESGAATDDDGKDLFEDGWHKVDGVDYWYEGGVRQGVKYNEDGSIDASYRGKEVYDPSSDAWYWLDCVQNGAVAKDKDVYQESQADDAGNAGKWVRYDADGHMVKGWQTTEAGTYYFDPTYGTMAKGLTKIDDKTYYFESSTGLQVKNATIQVNGRTYTCDENGVATSNERKLKKVIEAQTEQGEVRRYSVEEFDETGEKSRKTLYYVEGDILNWTDNVYEYGNIISSITYDKDGNVSGSKEYEYDVNGNQTKYTEYSSDGSVSGSKEYEYDVNGNQTKYTEYSSDGNVRWSEEYEYDVNGNQTKYVSYDWDGNVSRYIEYEYEYDVNGNQTKRVSYDGDGNVRWSEEYEYDVNGNQTKYVSYDGDGNASGYTEYEYDANGNQTKDIRYNKDGNVSGSKEYEYDVNGNMIKYVNYYKDGSISNWGEKKYDADGTLLLDVSYGAADKSDVRGYKEWQYK